MIGGEFWDIIYLKGVQDFSGLLGNVVETIVKEIIKIFSDGKVLVGIDMGIVLEMVVERF